MDIDRSEVNRAPSKAIAYKACGKDRDAEEWARQMSESEIAYLDRTMYRYGEDPLKSILAGERREERKKNRRKGRKAPTTK